MNDTADIPLGMALSAHYAASGLPQDGGCAAAQWEFLRLGCLVITLSNFQWRSRALRCHDIHHLLTGSPMWDLRGFR